MAGSRRSLGHVEIKGVKKPSDKPEENVLPELNVVWLIVNKPKVLLIFYRTIINKSRVNGNSESIFEKFMRKLQRELQNYPSDRFSGDFADLWHLMQIHILFRVGGLHQMPKIGEGVYIPI
jgi:hypothetical protein